MIDLTGINYALNNIFGFKVLETLDGNPDWYVVEPMPSYPIPYHGWFPFSPPNDKLLVHSSQVITGDDKHVFSIYYSWPAVIHGGELKAAWSWVAGKPSQATAGPTPYGLNYVHEFVVSIPNRHGYDIGSRFYTNYDSHIVLRWKGEHHYFVRFNPFYNQYQNLFGAKPSNPAPVIIGRKP